MLIEVDTPAAWPPASATCTVNAPAPEMGTPVTVPPVESVSPAGKAPELIDQLYGGVPPEAPRLTSA